MPISKNRKQTKQQGVQTITHKKVNGKMVKLKNTKTIYHVFIER